VYQFDREQNVLYPTAVSESVRSFLGPLPEFSLDQRSAVIRAFVGGRTKRPGAVDPPRTPGESLLKFGDYVTVPLADHGVLLVTAPAAGAFDDVDSSMRGGSRRETEVSVDTSQTLETTEFSVVRIRVAYGSTRQEVLVSEPLKPRVRARR
jgi:hypothetical protein